MAKDPAFLFYPGDWLGGTMGFTFEMKGCYFELLVFQFNNGGKFTKAQAKQVLNGSFDLAWPLLEQKFRKEGDCYYNRRLNDEIDRRKKFSESRRINGLARKKGKSECEAYAPHMETENINTNETEINKGGVGEKWNTKPGKELLDLELDPVKGGAVKQLFVFTKEHQLSHDELDLLWEIFKAQNFTGEKFYNSKNDVYSHFINWSKTQNVNGSPNQKQTNGGNYKTAGQGVYADRLKKQLTSLSSK